MTMNLHTVFKRVVYYYKYYIGSDLAYLIKHTRPVVMFPYIFTKKISDHIYYKTI